MNTAQINKEQLVKKYGEKVHAKRLCTDESSGKLQMQNKKTYTTG
jgi:hypothetical protein